MKIEICMYYYCNIQLNVLTYKMYLSLKSFLKTNYQIFQRLLFEICYCLFYNKGANLATNSKCRKFYKKFVENAEKDATNEQNIE